jgi:GNAT superfamily N-acetyltransferase
MCSSCVRQNIPEKYHELKVITSLLVLPKYQRKGIGRKLFEAAVMALSAQHEKAFILDCGYPTAQKYWTLMLGKPYSIKHKCWYGAIDHYFWVKKIENV